MDSSLDLVEADFLIEQILVIAHNQPRDAES